MASPSHQQPAIDILIALIQRSGELVSKRELISLVWPDTAVVDANLTVHIAALRRALGDGQGDSRYIVNIPGRGYRFVAGVTSAAQPARPSPHHGQPPHNLPAKLTRLIGRAGVVGNLAQQLSKQRLITIAGPGGIGKTAVALELAETLLSAYEHGVWLIDLAQVADPQLVCAALASALRPQIRSDNPLTDVIAALGNRRMLLVLDNCEHVVEAAARLVVEVLRGSRGVQIIATSREPLGIAGEHVHRLPVLETPPASIPLSRDEALGFSAVQLFVQHASATISDFELSDADAVSAGEICRKVDGIPLAIEFMAARTDIFGLRGLAASVDDGLLLLPNGNRAALARHHTFSSVLDWSYRLLSREEQAVLQRLAIFPGSFTLDAARAVASDINTGAHDIVDSVTALVRKSLITATSGQGDVRLRLLQLTRAYALAKLAASGEADVISRYAANREPLDAAA